MAGALIDHFFGIPVLAILMALFISRILLGPFYEVRDSFIRILF